MHPQQPHRQPPAPQDARPQRPTITPGHSHGRPGVPWLQEPARRPPSRRGEPTPGRRGPPGSSAQARLAGARPHHRAGGVGTRGRPRVKATVPNTGSHRRRQCGEDVDPNQVRWIRRGGCVFTPPLPVPRQQATGPNPG
jgi:hypothetical protein